MIVFDGYITGEAEKRVLEKIRDYEQNSFLIAGALLLPMWLLFAYKTGLKDIAPWVIFGNDDNDPGPIINQIICLFEGE